MSQNKKILDTNAYIRLAKCIHPLLNEEFGEKRYCLYIVKEVDEELSYNSRFQGSSILSWVQEEQYKENRKKYPILSRNDKKNLNTSYEFIWDYALRERQEFGVSRVDCKILAYGQITGFTIVTDDQKMCELAKEFEIKCIGILELLKIMFDCNHLISDEIKKIISWLSHMRDLPNKPSVFEEDFSKIFGKALKDFV